MKKISNYKGFILGMLFSVFLFSFASPAFAASFTKSAQLIYNDIKIMLNGQPVTPTDINGNVVEPFIIDGTTYLPLRAIANSLGLVVDWYAPTNTAYLYSTASPSPEPSPEPSPSAEPFDTALQGRLVTRINTCLKTANSQYSILQNKINDYISRGMGRSSGAQAAIAEQSTVSADISAMQSLQSSIRSAKNNDQLAQHETQVAYYEMTY